MFTPFETHTYFSIEMLWTTFEPTQDSSLTQCSQKILSDQPRLSIYNKIFLNLHYNLNNKIFNMKHECVRSMTNGSSALPKEQKKRSILYQVILLKVHCSTVSYVL